MNDDAPFDSPEPGAHGRFPTTHWSMVINAGAGPESRAHAALETLCRQYWYPLYAYVRRQGRAHHEAEDCTQEFLARLLAAGALTRARPERGRFRSFLLTAMRNFLNDEWDRTRAAKRGGGQVPLPFELNTAEEQFSREPADPGLTPEQAFDRNWAHGLLAAAMTALRTEYANRGQGALFAALAPFAWEDAAAGTAAESAARLGMTTHAFTVALHRLRGRLGSRLRADVAETVADESEVDAELRYLIAAIAKRSA